MTTVDRSRYEARISLPPFRIGDRVRCDDDGSQFDGDTGTVTDLGDPIQDAQGYVVRTDSGHTVACNARSLVPEDSDDDGPEPSCAFARSPNHLRDSCPVCNPEVSAPALP
jgi:hypothetical protein